MLSLRTLAAVAFLWLQESPQDWIRQLESEDPTVRDRASSALLYEGENSRAALEKAAESNDPETRLRARSLVGRLDAAKWSGGLGKSGAFWIDRAALALLANDSTTPDWIKPLLRNEAEVTFALVGSDGGRPKLQDILTARVSALTPEQVDRYGYRFLEAAQRGPMLIRHFVHGCMDLGFEVNGQRVVWEDGWQSAALAFGDWWNPSEVRAPADLFRVWPDLKAASLVFVAPSDGGKSLEKGLVEALSHPSPQIRLAATAVLGRFFTVDCVEALLPRLHDPDPGVVEATAATLKKLARAPKGSAAVVQEWWSKITDADRKTLLMVCLDDAAEAARGNAPRVLSRERPPK